MSRGTANTGYLQHTTINLFASAIIGIVIFTYYGAQAFHSIFWSMVFGTIFMNPDIDSNRSITYRMWTPLFRWYWYLYTYYMPHSGRSYFPFEVRRGIGHNLFIGTAIRILYASPLFVGVNELVNYLSLKLLYYPFEINWNLICFGIWLADALHIIVDAMFHRNKR